MTDDIPLVSVFMATYDREDVVGRAIESVLDQSYPNFELIIVDDCSPTDPREVVMSFDSDRITYLRHDENRGWGAAMNTAFDHASGRYIAMIGDDDRWSDPDKLRRQVELLRSRPEDLGIVCTGWRAVSEETGEVREVVSPSPPDNLERHILGENRLIQSISALVTREAWTVVGGCDETLPRGIDSDLFRRIIFAGYGVAFVPESMIDVYVDRDDRMTAKRDPEGIRPHIESERAKFEKFPERFERYPAARSRVLEKIGTHWIHLWEVTGDRSALASGRSSLREAIRHDPTNWKALARLVWSGPQQVGAPPLEILVDRTPLSRLVG
jgi:glycosyltransferase involved in cell wall biosynthesis